MLEKSKKFYLENNIHILEDKSNEYSWTEKFLYTF